MDWREFLEKDALDGKGANDKIKDPKWVDDPPVDDAYGKDVKIKPKKFLNVAHDAKLYRTDSEGDETESSKKITRKQTNSGKLTGLDDAHSNEVFAGRPNPRGDGGHRGDELGAVEHYKRKLRHGKMVGKPNFSLSSGRYDEDNKISGHEGRHRARAAMEEGHEAIPTKLVAYSGESADEYGVGLKNRERKNLKGLKYEDKKPKTDRSEDTRHPMLGRKKSWESWLEKNDPCWEGYEQYGMKDKDGKKVPNCIKKNNAIETSHKEDEKKHEWDGKFSSSTIRDDVKDDDDKAVSEEESLEELTDGKLEEVEKLKSDVDKIITDLARKIKNPKRREDIVQRQAEQKVKETVTKAWELFLVNKMPMNQYDKQPQKKPNEKGLKPEPLTETVPIPNPKGSIDPDKKTVSRLNHETGLKESVFIKGKPSTNPETDIGGGRPEEPNVVGDLKHGSVNATAGGTGRITQENTNSILYNALAEEEKEKEADNKTDDEVTISNDETDHATGVTEETPEEKRARIIRQFDRKKRDKKGKIIKSWEAWLEKKDVNCPDCDQGNTDYYRDTGGGGSCETCQGAGKLREVTNDKGKVKYQNRKRLASGYGGTTLTDVIPKNRVKSWESWLEKGRWDSDESKKKEKESREAKNELDRIKEWASQPEPKKTQRGRQAAERDEENSGKKYPAKKRVPLTRVQGHTRHLVSTGDTLAGDYEPIDTKEGENSPTHDQYLKRTGRSDHQLRTGREEQYITTDNAEKWKSWLEKENKPKKYSGLTPKQRKLQESIDSENDSDNQYYTKSWELWLEKGDKEEEFNKFDSEDLEMFGRHMNQENQRTDRIADDEIMGDVKNPILRETQEGAGGIPHATPSILNPNLTRKKPKYVKGVEQKGDDISPSQRALNIKIADSMKSWELWLEKDSLDGKQGIDGLPKSSIKPILADAQEVIDRDDRGKKNEMYKSWLEKMQGAGDARYGNQHLTGLDQKPVDNEEDEANILPEKEEKTDNKEEKQEETDNKPYKALGGE